MSPGGGGIQLSRIAAAPLALVLACCGAPRTSSSHGSSPPSSLRSSSAAPPTREPAPAPARASDPRAELVAPPTSAVSSACVQPLHTLPFDGLALRVARGARSYAWLPLDDPPNAGASLALLASDEGPAAFASLELRSGVSLRGWVAADDVHLFPKRAVLLGGFVAVGRADAVSWTQTRDGAVEIEYRPRTEPDAWGDRVRLTEPLRAHLACDEVDLEGVPPDSPDAAVMDVLPRPTAAAVAAGAGDASWFVGPGTVPLSLTPGGPAVAQVDVAQAEPNPARIVDVRATFVRVVWRGYLVGWIARSSLVRLRRLGGATYETRAPHLRQDTRVAPPRATLVCARPLRLVARTAETSSVVVGDVRAGAPIVVEMPAGSPDFQPVRVPRIEHDGTLGVTPADVVEAGCAASR